MQILIIEDEQRLADTIQKGLRNHGFMVDVAYTGRDGLKKLVNRYDALIVDMMLPEIDGLEIIKQIRNKKNQTPVLILTAKDSVSDKITGLEFGADDYLTKPFDFDELVARLYALIRRSTESDPILQIDTLTLNQKTKQVRRLEKIISLSLTEYRLLEYMLYHKNQILDESNLLEHVWDHEYDGMSNIVSVYIRYLRNKIDKPFPKEKKLIHTIRGQGYILTDTK